MACGPTTASRNSAGPLPIRGCDTGRRPGVPDFWQNVGVARERLVSGPQNVATPREREALASLGILTSGVGFRRDPKKIEITGFANKTGLRLVPLYQIKTYELRLLAYWFIFV